MPNLVLQSNIVNKTFIIEHKVLSMPVQPGIVELVITPLSKYTIDAKDFRTGLLPKEISNIEFENLGKNVIAKVYIKSVVDLKKTLNISMPISGTSFAKKETFNVVTTTNVDKRIIVTNMSTHPRSVSGNNITYNISNDLGKKTLLFTKKFTVAGDDYFSLVPKYNIKNKNTNYTVTSRVEKGMKNKILSKTFDVFYTSPSVVSKNSDSEIIFDAQISTPKIRVANKKATKKEEHKIYSIDHGRNIGSRGGIKTMLVKGVPGTPFKILASNALNKAYNPKTRTFENEGRMIEGVIPPASFGRHFGEAKVAIRIPRSTSAETITVKVVDDIAIDHKAITSPATADIATNVSSGAVKTIESNPIAKLTVGVELEAGATDFIGPIVTLEGGAESTGQILLGAGNAEALTFVEPQTYEFSFEVKVAGGAKFVQIERQPLFVMPTDGVDNFVAWDSGSTKADATTSAGVSIPSDWDFDSGLSGGVDVNIKTTVKGVGTFDDGGSGFSSVLVKGKIVVNKIGNTDTTVNLKLLNFLTQVTPS